MNCLRFERRIALYIGGELDEADARRTEAHLAGCADCRGLAQALRAARTEMADWNATVPSEDDLRAVRANVLSAIADHGSGTVAESWRAALAGMRWWRAAALGGLAALLVGSVWLAASRSGTRDQATGLAVLQHEAPARAPVAQAPASRMADAGVARPTPVAPGPRPSTTATRRHARHAVSQPPAPVAASLREPDGLPAPTLGRLEFRTADPKIRIVWLLQEPTPASLPLPSDRRVSDDDRAHLDEKGPVS
jgi:hypothetical protein